MAEMGQARLEQAIEAFRGCERAEFLLDRKRAELHAIMRHMPDERMSEYVEETEKIVREFEEKRDRAKI